MGSFRDLDGTAISFTETQLQECSNDDHQSFQSTYQMDIRIKKLGDKEDAISRFVKLHIIVRNSLVVMTGS
jgi:hypothetical protein